MQPWAFSASWFLSWVNTYYTLLGWLSNISRFAFVFISIFKMWNHRKISQQEEFKSFGTLNWTYFCESMASLHSVHIKSCHFLLLKPQKNFTFNQSSNGNFYKEEKVLRLQLYGNTAEADKKLLQCCEPMCSSTYIITSALGKPACLFFQESLSSLFFPSSVFPLIPPVFFSVKTCVNYRTSERAAWLSGQTKRDA